ncbi:MAG: hypothetical protein JNK82_01200 [Myxococcaceae bacterium]|nr:hypothetical protein [Myxococcaceae bacterium]
MKSGVPDYRNDSAHDVVARMFPRVTVSLLGVLLSVAGWVFQPAELALYNTLACGFVLMFAGVRGFWLPYVKYLQLAVAAWLGRWPSSRCENGRFTSSCGVYSTDM